MTMEGFVYNTSGLIKVYNTKSLQIYLVGFDFWDSGIPDLKFATKLLMQSDSRVADSNPALNSKALYFHYST